MFDISLEDLFVFFTHSSVTHEIQGGAEETHVFQMASTRQGWG